MASTKLLAKNNGTPEIHGYISLVIINTFSSLFWVDELFWSLSVNLTWKRAW
jgi:hypothetical protein